jgi:hypothetical protein
MKRVNSFKIEGDVVAIYLNGKQGTEKYTIVSLDDFYKHNLVSERYNWTAQKSGHVLAWDKDLKKLVYLHRIISNADELGYVQVDHKDSNPLNNLGSNLRGCTAAQNQLNAMRKTNTTGYKNVSYCKNNGEYGVNLRINKEKAWFGSYPTPEQAAYAYDLIAPIFGGEFPILNGIEDKGLLTEDEKVFVEEKLYKRVEKYLKKKEMDGEDKHGEKSVINQSGILLDDQRFQMDRNWSACRGWKEESLRSVSSN